MRRTRPRTLELGSYSMGSAMTTSTFLRRAVWLAAVGLVTVWIYGILVLLMAL